MIIIDATWAVKVNLGVEYNGPLSGVSFCANSFAEATNVIQSHKNWKLLLLLRS